MTWDAISLRWRNASSPLIMAWSYPGARDRLSHPTRVLVNALRLFRIYQIREFSSRFSRGLPRGRGFIVSVTDAYAALGPDGGPSDSR